MSRSEVCSIQKKKQTEQDGNAWTFLPSSYAIEVYDENDIVNAVKFARDFNIRLVVKGTGMF